MPVQTDSRAAADALTPRVLLRILRDLIDALNRDMLITHTAPTPGGIIFTVPSRSRLGRTHTVCRLKRTRARPRRTYSCTCEHGLQIEEFTPGNRHAHCWHVRFVHFLTLPTPARQQLLTCATGHLALTDQQRALRAAWVAYLARRRTELTDPPPDRPGAPFLYALAARSAQKRAG
jgi:hypothetical protein